MALVSLTSPLDELLFLRLRREVISGLASVVSEGSPGSTTSMSGTAGPLLVGLSVVTADRVLGRLEG